jgi:1-acyl-sn-glycerol-3-phosphate acyltransferase
MSKTDASSTADRKSGGPQAAGRRDWRERLFYRALRALTRMVSVIGFDATYVGRHHLDFPGPALLLSTHQSTLDPMLVGLMSNREMCYLARKTLFKSRVFAAMIRALNAIEIDREGGGLAGLKETLKRLKHGHKVLIFPEGTRTPTGSPIPLKPGFIALARRGSIPLVPMAVTGAYQILRRGSRLPAYYPVCLVVDQPLMPEQVATLSDDELLAEVQRRLLQCHVRATETADRVAGLRSQG